MVVVVQHHAIEALHAFALVDLALRVNRMGAATAGAGMAGLAFGLALQAEQAQLARDGKAGAQRANVFAIRPLAKEGPGYDAAYEQPERPGAVPDAD